MLVIQIRSQVITRQCSGAWKRGPERPIGNTHQGDLPMEIWSKIYPFQLEQFFQSNWQLPKDVISLEDEPTISKNPTVYQPPHLTSTLFNGCNIDGLVQERRNSIANALELHLPCAKPSSHDTYVVSYDPQGIQVTPQWEDWLIIIMSSGII